MAVNLIYTHLRIKFPGLTPERDRRGGAIGYQAADLIHGPSALICERCSQVLARKRRFSWAAGMPCARRSGYEQILAPIALQDGNPCGRANAPSDALRHGECSGCRLWRGHRSESNPTAQRPILLAVSGCGKRYVMLRIVTTADISGVGRSACAA